MLPVAVNHSFLSTLPQIVTLPNLHTFKSFVAEAGKVVHQWRALVGALLVAGPVRSREAVVDEFITGWS